jgi:hypothetical protein
MDVRKCLALKNELANQPEPQRVRIDRFFDGNDDPGSIGCNLVPHPGMAAFREVLVGLQQHPGVTAVHALVSELDPGEGSWPFADTVVVTGTLDAEALRAALAKLHPDEVGPVDRDAPGVSLSAQETGSALFAWWD